ncbi:RNA-directed DNA polymerase [Leuconostoc sp. MS02]|uniref:RNA-directed DNA polymerase n=1 Tax=Leuconostoc aquikimchii TaxID=3236804 RepID=A0ABV3S3Q7_9LACO
MANNYFLRTDILPEEIPALFSNQVLYTNDLFSEKKIKKEIKTNTNNPASSLEQTCQYGFLKSKPLNFTTRVSRHKVRKMSLLHPGAQIQALYFILKFEDDILDSMNSNFSFRMPLRRNKNTIRKKQKKQNEMSEMLSSFDLKSGVSSEESVENFAHYFSYAWAPSFSGMASNSKFKEIQLKYKVSKKIDLQNFFPSIYTHSLTWALLGSKSIAKEIKDLKGPLSESFEVVVDSLMQSINFQETNGIVVGPEFSRIIAELLMTKVDKSVEKKLLESCNKVNNQDFCVIRYVDDIFIFSNDPLLNDMIENQYASSLRTFNLSINDSKIKNFPDTTSILYTKVVELKKIFLDFKKSRFIEFSEQKNFESSDTTIEQYLGSTYLWEVLLDNVNNLILNEPSRKDILVNYSLSSLHGLIKFSQINSRQTMSILVGVTSLLKTNFCFKSVRHYIVFVSRILKEIDSIIDNESNFSILLSDTKISNEPRGIINFIFQHICNVLTSDWFEISEGYEIVTLMEFFKKYDYFLPSFILQKFLKQRELLNDYFVLTAITNYVYDSKNHIILKEYISVYESVCELLTSKLSKYKHEGIAAVENGNFFYLLNDFYYFPGKSKIFRSILQAKFQTEIDKLQGSKNKSSELSGISYYQWGASFDHFLEMVLRKKVIDSNFNFDGLTSV